MNCKKEKCICPNTSCDNHGKCCQCVANHNKYKSLTYCTNKIMNDEGKKEK